MRIAGHNRERSIFVTAFGGMAMWRLISVFFVGMILAVVPLNVLSVYVFHDVDRIRSGGGMPLSSN